VTEHSTDLAHSIQFWDTWILAMKTGYMEHIIREATELSSIPITCEQGKMFLPEQGMEATTANPA